MTLLYDDAIFLQHDTGQHPECAGRIAPIRKQLPRLVTELGLTPAMWNPATREQLARVHDPEYIGRVKAFAKDGGGRLEADTVVSPPSYDVALMAAGAVCDAVTRVVGGEDKRAFCLVRPPGHHALHDDAMGFCLFNNIAVASRLATTSLGLDKILIVDWDVHHGNGTQDAFYEDPQVGFFSIHRWPFYPGTGDVTETGTGKGLGTTANVPVKFGTSREDYLSKFTTALTKIARSMRPQLVLISAGFDAHLMDPIGSLGLLSIDFHPLTNAVVEVANEYAGGRIVSVLEGGYHPHALAECVEVHLEALGESNQ